MKKKTGKVIHEIKDATSYFYVAYLYPLDMWSLWHQGEEIAQGLHGKAEIEAWLKDIPWECPVLYFDKEFP